MTNVDYGTVAHNGITIQLTQEAYVESSGVNVRPWYQARGVDADGNEYMVRWEIKDGLATGDDNYDEDAAEQAGDDESLMCDWDEYTVRAL